MEKEVSLLNLRKGEKAAVAALLVNEKHLPKLMAFGILPGVEVEVRQVYPGFVLAVGKTLLALDCEIASSILVNKLKM